MCSVAECLIFDGFLIILLVSVCCVSVVETSNPCHKTENSCKISPTCGMQYMSVLIHCSAVTETQTAPNGSECSEECQNSLKELSIGTPEGASYTGCHCPKDDLHYCSNHNKVFACINSALRKATVSCSSARGFCESDTDCNSALKYFDDVCGAQYDQHLRGHSCSSTKCLESYGILMRRKNAEHLYGCNCDFDVTDSRITVKKNVFCLDSNRLLCNLASQSLVFILSVQYLAISFISLLLYGIL